MHTGPLPRLPSKKPSIFLRTIYLWHTLALFTKNNRGKFMKPSEGISKNTAKRLKKLCRRNGGCWIWICSSKSTDIAPEKEKKSYVYGVVFVADVIKTKKYNKLYLKQRFMNEYKHSSVFRYQAIVLSHDYARLELNTPIEVHSPKKGESRASGLWTPNADTALAQALKQPVFL